MRTTECISDGTTSMDQTYAMLIQEENTSRTAEVDAMHARNDAEDRRKGRSRPRNPSGKGCELPKPRTGDEGIQRKERTSRVARRDPEPRCHFLQRGSSAAVRGNGHRRNANTRLQALLHPREGNCTPGPCGRWMRIATICALRCRPQTYSNPPSDLAASSSAMGLVGVLSCPFWEAAASAAEGTDPPRICIGCA